MRLFIKPRRKWVIKMSEIGVFRHSTGLVSDFTGGGEHWVDVLHDYWGTKCTDKVKVS